MTMTGNCDRSDNKGRPWVGVGSRGWGRLGVGGPGTGRGGAAPRAQPAEKVPGPLFSLSCPVGPRTRRSRWAFCNTGNPGHRKIPEAPPPAALSPPWARVTASVIPGVFRRQPHPLLPLHQGPHLPGQRSCAPLQNPPAALKDPLSFLTSTALTLEHVGQPRDRLSGAHRTVPAPPPLGPDHAGVTLRGLVWKGLPVSPFPAAQAQTCLLPGGRSARSPHPGHACFPAADRASHRCASCDSTHRRHLPGSVPSDRARTSYLRGRGSASLPPSGVAVADTVV